MPTLAVIATGFLAIIAVGTVAAWIHDLLEARFAGRTWDDLPAWAQRMRDATFGTPARSVRRPARALREHRQRAPAYVVARQPTTANRVVFHSTTRDRVLRS